ncbi:MAG: riboflavin biosynthesis protein RibF [Clostridiales bacterium]|nr:riboflavin biosynthesis protein RibF [Clostridiales bacterium]
MSLEFTHKFFIDTLPFAVEGRVIALGMFDGLHEGHMEIIKNAVRTASKNNMRSCVQTFINLPKSEGGVITTVDEQCEILSAMGVDELVVLDYNEVCDLSPQQFVTDYLLMRMGAALCMSGEDYRFGKGASGDVEVLKTECSSVGIDVIVVPQKERDGRVISSSWLREALANGRPDEFASLCRGRYFSYTGRVIHGKMMGRKMGFPTANIEIPSQKIPARRGVYASRVKLGKRDLYGVTNIGLRPTLEDTDKDICETFIFDFDEDIYGAEIRVELCEFLRDEQRFAGSDELIRAVEDNKQKVRELFGI